MDRIGVIYREKFKNKLPIPFTGTWELAGKGFFVKDGIVPAADITWQSYFYWKQSINLDNDSVSFKILLRDKRSVFRVARMASPSRPGFSSTAEFDGKTRNISLYQTVASINDIPDKVLVKRKISFDIFPDREYYCTLSCNAERVFFEIMDTEANSAESIEFLSTGTGEKNPGRCWCYPVFYLHSGSVVIREFIYLSDMPASPKAVILGNSITEGDTLRNEVGGGYRNRWAGRLYDELGGNVAILGTAGETSSEAIEKLPVIDRIFKKPEFALLAHFTNDHDFDTYYKNTSKLISLFKAKGAVPVICIFPRRRGREEFHRQVVSWAYKSNNKLVDFAEALTVNGDRETPDQKYYLPDMLHPNVLGHRRMFERIKIDLPELFR
jgi:lysophospholipase L1-like esterase